jgi:hypothetical protein
MKTWLKVLIGIVALGIVAFGVLQFFRPAVIGHNPPLVRQAVWPNAQGEALARLACYECHSNETKWYWYGYVMPVSLLLASDVSKGRRNMNFSDWQPDREPTAAAREQAIRSGLMPKKQFLWIHKEARLTAQQKETLIEALKGIK